MGNCLFRGTGTVSDAAVEVVTANGGIMELCGPTTVASITREFPGHAVFRTHHHHLLRNPLPQDEVLLPGESYHLLPSKYHPSPPAGGLSRTNSGIAAAAAAAPKYRMSSNSCRRRRRSTGKEGMGLWKVKLVISRPQLLHILSEEASMEQLVWSVNAVAKCGAPPSGFPSHLLLPSMLSGGAEGEDSDAGV